MYCGLRNFFWNLRCWQYELRNKTCSLFSSIRPWFHLFNDVNFLRLAYFPIQTLPFGLLDYGPSTEQFFTLIGGYHSTFNYHFFHIPFATFLTFFISLAILLGVFLFTESGHSDHCVRPTLDKPFEFSHLPCHGWLQHKCNFPPFQPGPGKNRREQFWCSHLCIVAQAARPFRKRPAGPLGESIWLGF